MLRRRLGERIYMASLKQSLPAVRAHRVEIVLDNRIRVPEGEIPFEVSKALQEKFLRKNPIFWKLRAIGRRAWGVTSEVKCWRREGDDLTFGRGAWGMVRDVLLENDVAYKVVDRRERGPIEKRLEHFVVLRDYQEEQVGEALAKENCILRASTGAGKTTIGLAFAALVETNVLVIVDSTDIGMEWSRRAEKELGIKTGWIGKGTKKLGRITVALHQALHAMKEDAFESVNRYFGAVVVDEVQVLGAKTYGANVDRLRARYRLGLSDDHHRSDGQTFLVTDLMGKVVNKIGDKQLLKRGAIAGVEVIADALDFEAPWFSNREPDEDGNQPKATAEEFTRLLAEMAADDHRSSKIAARVADEVSKGKSFLVFSHRTEHCRVLEKMLSAAGVPTGLMLGGTSEFEVTRSGLLSGLVKAGIGTMKALGKGVNVPAVDAGYAATPVATSSQTWRQAKGRVIRPKEDGGSADFWIAWDRYVFGDAPIRKLSKWHRGHVRIAVGSEVLTPAEYAGQRKGTNDGSPEGTRNEQRESGSSTRGESPGSEPRRSEAGRRASRKTRSATSRAASGG
jgi:superfamily II DNA or RNA helicase